MIAIAALVFCSDISCDWTDSGSRIATTSAHAFVASFCCDYPDAVLGTSCSFPDDIVVDLEGVLSSRLRREGLVFAARRANVCGSKG